MDKLEKRALIGAAAIVVALLIWWASHWVATAPTSGVITEKAYHPPYTSMMYAGKVYIPQYHPEHWGITLYNSKLDRSWEYSVTHETYDQFKVGDNINFK